MDGSSSSVQLNATQRLDRLISVVYALLFASIAPLIYLSLYLQRRGLTDAQIGSVIAVAALVGIVAPPLWGYLSDRWNNRPLPLALASLASALLFIGYFGASFPTVLFVATFFALFNSPLIPLLDAFVLERLGDAKERYGRLRAFGSWGFIGMMTLFGLVLKRHGDSASLFPAFFSFIALRILMAGIALKLPRNGGCKLTHDDNGQTLRQLFADRQWLSFLSIMMVSMVTYSTFYAFFPLYLNRVGVSDNWQAYFWVIAVLAEVAFMSWVAEPLIKRIGLKGVLLLGFAGRALRLGLYALPLLFPVLLMCQLFHALSFAAFHTASVTWISSSAPPQARALTQALYSGVMVGISMAVGAQFGGIVSQHFGLHFLFGIAGAINAIAFLAGWLWLKEPFPSPVKAKVEYAKA